MASIFPFVASHGGAAHPAVGAKKSATQGALGMCIFPALAAFPPACPPQHSRHPRKCTTGTWRNGSRSHMPGSQAGLGGVS
jgi:hypothetical protein